MRSIDILYYCLALATLGIAGGFIYIAYFLVENLKSFKKVVDDVVDVSGDIRGTKDYLKKDVLAKLFGLAKDFFASKYEQRSSASVHST